MVMARESLHSSGKVGWGVPCRKSEHFHEGEYNMLGKSIVAALVVALDSKSWIPDLTEHYKHTSTRAIPASRGGLLK